MSKSNQAVLVTMPLSSLRSPSGSPARTRSQASSPKRSLTKTSRALTMLPLTFIFPAP